MSRRRGRPTKLTKTLQRQLCAAVGLGNYLETAAASCGLAAATLRSWMRRGERTKDGLFKEFLAALRKAQAKGEKHDLAVIGAAAKEHWQAAAWRLERRYPERWALSQRINVEVDKRAADMIKALEGRLPDAIYRQVLRALAVDDPTGGAGAARGRARAHGADADADD